MAQTQGVSTSSDVVTTFKIGRAAVLNPFIVHNALDILHRLKPTISSFSDRPSLGLGILSLCVFASFKAAKSLCNKGMPTPIPVYTQFYRKFRSIVEGVRCLKSRR